MLTLLLVTVLAAPGPQSAAVLPLGLKGKAKKDVVEVLDDLLLSSLQAQAAGVRVIGKADIDTMIGFEKTKDALGCDQVACAVEMAGALGVDSVISGNVGVLGKKYMLTLVWIDQKQAQVIRRISEDLGVNEETFDAGVARAVASLLGLEARPAVAAAPTTLPVVVEARGTPDYGVYPLMQLWVDGKKHSEWPTTGSPASYRAEIPATACTVSVVFANDTCSACFNVDPKQDRNLEVLSLKVGERTYRPGSPGLSRMDCATYEDVASVGWLYCEPGWLTVSVAPPATPSKVVVRARGDADRGAFPNMRVIVNGKLIRAIPVAADMRDYEVATAERACWAQVNFDNDSCSACEGKAGGGDRNLEVESVTLDGKKIETLDDRVSIADCWFSDGTKALGRPATKYLMCQAEGFLFRP
jgi:hypothetical protein